MSLSPLRRRDVNTNKRYFEQVDVSTVDTRYQVNGTAWPISRLTKAIRREFRQQTRITASDGQQNAISDNTLYMNRGGLVLVCGDTLKIESLWEPLIIKLSGNPTKEAIHYTVETVVDGGLLIHGHTAIQIFNLVPHHGPIRHLQCIPPLMLTCEGDIIVYPSRVGKNMYNVAYVKHGCFACIVCHELFNTAAEWSRHAGVSLNFASGAHWHRVLMDMREPYVDRDTYTFRISKRVVLDNPTIKHYQCGSLMDPDFATTEAQYMKWLASTKKYKNRAATSTFTQLVKDAVYAARRRWINEARANLTNVFDFERMQPTTKPLTTEQSIFKMGVEKRIQTMDKEYVKHRGAPMEYVPERVQWIEIDANPTDTVDAVIQRVQETRALPVHRIRLYFRATIQRAHDSTLRFTAVLQRYRNGKRATMADYGLTTADTTSLGLGQFDGRWQYKPIPNEHYKKARLQKHA